MASWSASIAAASGKPDRLQCIQLAVYDKDSCQEYGETEDPGGDDICHKKPSNCALKDMVKVIDGQADPTDVQVNGFKFDDDKFKFIKLDSELIGKRGKGGAALKCGRKHVVVAKCKELDRDKSDMLTMCESVLSWLENA